MTIQTNAFQARTTGIAPSVFVLHENESWVRPLSRELDRLDVPHQHWFLGQGMVPVHQVPPEGIFYNRIGASAHLRGNPHAPELTALILDWLGRHGRRVVNAREALAMELSKTTQHAALERAGIAVPRTIPAVGRDFVIEAVKSFGSAPVMLKHNRGGKGHGVKRVNSAAEAAAWLDDPACDQPLDGVWLVQEYIKAPEPYILRAEFVGGRFLYAMRVNTSEGFALCPAEVCSLSSGANKYQVTNALDGDPLVGALERFLADNQIDIASVEAVRHADGRLRVFDVNTNTNYNERAEIQGKLATGGMGAVAAYLKSLLPQGATASAA